MSCRPHIQIEDLPAEMENLSAERAVGIRGGEVALTHEDSHQSNDQTAPPPHRPPGIIAILIG